VIVSIVLDKTGLQRSVALDFRRINDKSKAVVTTTIRLRFDRAATIGQPTLRP